VAELDLTEAIEAAAVPIWQANNPDYPIDRESDAWEACQQEARDLIEVALPHIERAVRSQVAQELLDWAHSLDRDNPNLRTKRRHISMCAQRIAPEPTEDEMREAIAGLLSGMAGRVCNLDDAGRPIPPGERT